MGPGTGPRFLRSAPVLAVEVRSEDDYGPAAEAALAAKRSDCFEAGPALPGWTFAVDEIFE